MEIIVIVCVLVFVVWLIRPSADTPRVPPPQERSNVLPPLNLPKGTPAPFNSITSEPVPEPHKITGAAYVVDGDSIVIKKTQVRLFGVDAPEMNHPYGKKAKWALVKLCKGQTIRAEVTDVDAHGRTVAKCYLPDGRDLSAEMVKQGLAIDWPKFSGGVYRALEVHDSRKRMWLADARQKGRMHVWEKFEANQKARARPSGQ